MQSYIGLISKSAVGYSSLTRLFIDSPGISLIALILYSSLIIVNSGAPNGNFLENICSEDDLRSRIFGAFAVKFLACPPLLGFSNIYKMV